MKDKENILAKWLSGELSDKELEVLEGTETLKSLQQMTEEINKWSMPKYDTGSGYQKMKEKLTNRSPKSETSKWLKIIVFVSIIGLFLYGLISFLGAQVEKIKAPPGQDINYAFQDGSEVWLNDASSLSYKTKEWKDQRTIELEGEAMFEVTKGAPFTVKTANGTITVLGTKFNVRAWGENLHVECYEGRVQVQSGDQQLILTVMESVSVIDNTINKENINNISPLWLDGMSRFYNDKLRFVCNEIERQYRIDVELIATDRSFSGTFRHDDLDLALRSICGPLNLKYTISSDKKSVVIE